MGKTGQEERETPDESRTEASSEGSGLPTEKGFLLQLTRDTGPTLAQFAGRVEHLASGKRLRFANFEAFREALSRLLDLKRR